MREHSKTKTQISFAVTAKLISAFVFVTRIVQYLFFLNPKFQAYRQLLWPYRPVCVGPGRKPRRPVFSQRGSLHRCVNIIICTSCWLQHFSVVVIMNIARLYCLFGLRLYVPVNNFFRHVGTFSWVKPKQ